MPPLLPEIPLQAKELLNFDIWSDLCVGILFLFGFGLLLLAERLFCIARKGIFRTLFLCVYCALCAGAVYINGVRQGQQSRLQLAQEIAFSRDLDAESRFSGIIDSLQAAGIFSQHYLSIDSISEKDSLVNRWQTGILDRSFSHYRCFFTFCEPEELLLVEDGSTENCRAFFNKKAENGTPTGFPALYGIDYGIEYYAYLYQTPVYCGADTFWLNMELGRKKFADVPGGEGLRLPPSYSYAFYSQNELWSYNGSLLYAIDLKKEPSDSICFIDYKGYSHLFYPLPQERLLVLSTPRADPLDLLYNFSLFFIFFGITGSLIFALTDKNFFGQAGTYARQLKSGMFLFLLFVVFVFGAVAVVFIRQINLKENTLMLRNQSLAVLAEMESHHMNLPGNCLLRPQNDSIINRLHKEIENISNLFRKDIYLYSTQGRLVSAPRPESLMPEQLDKDILEEIAEEQNHLIVLQRNMTLLAFTSFRNIYGETIGFLCIPYYRPVEKQRAEMSRFLCTYLNIMVLLSLLTLGFSSLLARRITKPLQLMSRMVGQIRPGGKNQHLEWKRKDEIGVLVNQYNLLVDELESSLRKLAESERESAWNEMARQVAHEIKNPLTPIKLQVQLLQRAYHNDTPEVFGTRLEKFAALLNEQIDRLSHIAGTFSQFAKWQKPHIEEISPVQIIRKTIELFKADEKMEFIEELPPQSEKIRIYADSGFLEQILVNLIRNAVQAMEEAQTPSPTVRVGLRQEPDGACLLYVADNGPGIESGKLENIFEPHFTTRSTGAGLGLAICRRLAESMDAEISAKSEAGKGTRFTLRMTSAR